MYNTQGLIYDISETKHLLPTPPHPLFFFYPAGCFQAVHMCVGDELVKVSTFFVFSSVLCGKKVTPLMQGFESTQCKILLYAPLAEWGMFLWLL